MKDVTIKQLDEMDYYKGPGEIPGIKFYSAAKQLGVTAWGMNVLKLDPTATQYPDHDHAGDGQEEVYFVVDGDAVIHVGDETANISKGMFVHVANHVKRRFMPGSRGVTLLAVGGTPGKAFEPRK